MAEAKAAGTPVVAFGRGGAADIIAPLHADRPTGGLFAEQSLDAVKEAVDVFGREARRIRPAACRPHVERFAPENFRRRLHALIEEVMQPDFSRWADAPAPAPAPRLLRL